LEAAPMIPEPPQTEAGRLPAPGLLGQLPAMRDDPLGLFMDALALGPVVKTRFAWLDAALLFDPDLVQTVLVDRVAIYRKQTRGYQKLRLLLGEGLVTSEGSFWLRQRRIAAPAFHKERIATFGEVMVDCAEDVVRDIAPSPEGAVVDLHDHMMRATLRIAGLTLLSRDLAGEARVVGRAVSTAIERFNDLITSPLPWPEYWPSAKNWHFHRALRQLDRVVREIIADRRRTGEDPGDLLSMWMQTRDVETGEAMDDTQLRDEVMTMFVAGHETTAVALSWTLHLLARHPDVSRRATETVDAALSGRRPSFADLPRLGYLGQVFDEALRLYPPVWVLARRAAEDDVLGGVAISQGTFVFIAPYAIHRHPRHWPEPERFDPDRFAPERVAERKAAGFPRLAYLPFSGGPRKCIGEGFARMEGVLILATLLQQLRFAPPPSGAPEPDPQVTLRPRDGMPLMVSKRD
jgi:cytochrome P450